MKKEKLRKRLLYMRASKLYKYRFRLVFGLAFLMLLSACNSQKNADSEDGTKNTKDKASKKEKKNPKSMCYCPAF
ncbi:MAG: hypothetical protein JXR53_00020 [Bacteroidales bacterium]|nr:hypothetical protein [Bacteroidales bacterium]